MNIKVKLLDGNEHEIPVNSDTTCEQLKNKIKGIVNLMPTEQTLKFNQIELSNPNERLTTYRITNGSVLNLIIKFKNFKVTVTRQDKITIDMDVSSENTIQSLKENIQRSWNKPIEQQTLMFRGEKLENNKKLSDYGIVEKCLISLFPKVSNNEIQVIVYVESGRNIVVKINVNEYIRNLKSKIQQKINIENTYLTLVYQGELLDDDKTIDHYEIETCSVIIAHRTISRSMDKIKLFAKSLDGQVFAFDVEKYAKIIDIKNNIYKKLLIHPDDQKLIFGGAILWDDNENIDEYQICENSVIQVLPRMRF